MLFIIPLLFHSITLNYTIWFFYIFQFSKMVLKWNPAFQSDDPSTKLKALLSGSLLSRALCSTGARTDPLASFFHFVNKQMISSCFTAFSSQLQLTLELSYSHYTAFVLLCKCHVRQCQKLYWSHDMWHLLLFSHSWGLLPCHRKKLGCFDIVCSWQFHVSF